MSDIPDDIDRDNLRSLTQATITALIRHRERGCLCREDGPGPHCFQGHGAPYRPEVVFSSCVGCRARRILNALYLYGLMTNYLDKTYGT